MLDVQHKEDGADKNANECEVIGDTQWKSLVKMVRSWNFQDRVISNEILINDV